MTADRAPGTPNGAPLPNLGDDMDWEALARYFAGESPVDERARVRRWLDQRPEESDRLERLHAEVARAGGARTAAVDVEAALARVRDRVDVPDVRPIESAHPRSRWRSRWVTPGLVAAAAALLVIGTQLTRNAADAPPRFRAVLETAVGERDSVRLGDGTLVVLGPASRLLADQDYGRTRRALALEGTGYFHVRHDDRPFTVRAGDVVVRDIGTAFTVQARETVEVVVTEGAVGVSVAAGPEAVLEAGDVARVTPAGVAEVERQAATEADVAWRHGRLIFRDTPLPRVAEELARWYGVTIRLADPGLASRRLTAELHGESREEALRIVELALGVRIETHGDTSVVRAEPREGSGR